MGYLDSNGLSYFWGKIKSYIAGLGYYTKPSGGIPASDMASGVIPTVPTTLSSFTDDLGSSPTHTHSQYLTSAPVTSVNGQTGAVSLSIPTESTVSGWGFTKNAGTITGITMNGASKGTSGVVDLGTVITAHQDISGKANISDLADVATSGDYDDLLNVPDIVIISSSESTEDLTIEDEQGNVLARFLNGHFEVKNFNTANKVTSISSSSTDAQFPSAKCVYDLVGDIETLLASI